MTRKLVPAVTKKFVGAHVSIAGGLWEAVEQTAALDASAFALFLGSQRTWWRSRPISKEESDRFKRAMKFHSIRPEMVLPHGSYLINLGSHEADKLKNSRELMLDEMKRSASLGLKMVNIHPGSTRGKISVEDCCKLIAESINYIHSKTTKECPDVSVILENTAGQGNTMGRSFKELSRMIELVEDKTRVGICIDTCHLFAAGGGDEGLTDERDASNAWIGFEKSMERFEAHGLLKYLRGMHLNDSKVPFGEKKDRHESLGAGHIGWKTFEFVMRDPRFDNIPLILETPTSHLGPIGRQVADIDSNASSKTKTKTVSVPQAYLHELEELKGFASSKSPKT